MFNLASRPARVLILVALLVAIFAPVSIPYRILVLAAAAAGLIYAETGGLAALGLRRRRWRDTAGWAVLLAISSILIGEFVQPAIAQLLGTPIDYSAYGALAGNADAATRLLIFALTSAAIGEEIVFRGFLVRQLTELLGERAWRSPLVVAISALVFGAAHGPQGSVGIITTGIVGALYAAAYLRNGRNLWALMLAHACTDSYGIAMLYFGRYA
ncbi:membrane protease YdiL (CAAX protease family) [Sphingomonas sp. SORGH_AS 950]|uniref:CPBP family intramembrane glutamic endopeptidase n=1 Tax=unclassified Sphingomonas TaxID=196159 RepID=UPI00278548F3|nr:type II CAAX endopeptidase family protein [Sphingomonas sp. SORGH_AS_0950]MDQ1159013.1 membrane protease YdiL (CAAX protease family) [Sphingomonas sp. SORGH_AS_0950]